MVQRIHNHTISRCLKILQYWSD